jgi:hypothetical protein
VESGVRERVLLEFLVGRVGPTVLRRELLAEERSAASPPPSAPPSDFELLPLHLLRLCDAVLDRELDAALLGRIASRLASSARSRGAARDPDARVVQEVLESWTRSAGPGLDLETVAIYRRWVVTRRNPFPGA